MLSPQSACAGCGKASKATLKTRINIHRQQQAAAEVSVLVGRAKRGQPGAGSGSRTAQLEGAVIRVATCRQCQPLYGLIESHGAMQEPAWGM